MAKKKFWLGMPVIALALGMAVLSACSSGPKAYEAIEPITPDEDSAVVYFFGNKGNGNIWDGETPIGSFFETSSIVAGVVWKTTPGEHYFIANASNWVVMRADLEPNKRYYLRIIPVASPPFTTIIGMVRMNQAEGEAWLKQVKKPVSFTDAWRVKFAQGKQLQEVRENLQSAQNRSMDIDLSGIHGIGQ